MANAHLNGSDPTASSFRHPLSTSSSPALPSSRQTDSWIDLSSQPSSSSLSSATDDVVTHGLRVVHDPHPRRRRRTNAPQANAGSPLVISDGRPSSAGGSSQEEYDESESESDRVMTSSNEAQPTAVVSEGEDSASPDVFDLKIAGEKEDQNATASDIGNAQDQACFTPQPNAFTHPPSSQLRSQRHASGSYFPVVHSTQCRTPHERRSFSSQTAGSSHPSKTTTSPMQTADHEAALRASLTTLLSCAAAARSLPKNEAGLPNASKTKTIARTSQPPPRSTARVDPSSLRLIPASALPRRRSASATSSSPSSKRTTSTSPTRSPTSSEKGKRKAARSASSSRRSRSSERASKRLRSVGVDEAGISPTLLTWVLSAGVLVLVSALSFSAGYSAGKEEGRFEAGLMRGGKVGGQCGRQAAGKGAAGSGLGLRRRLLGAARGVTA